MKKTNLIIFALLFTLFASCDNKTEKLNRKADEAINQVLSNYNYVGLAVAVVNENKIVYSNEFGVKNVETQEKIKKDDLFRIASISKTFTSTAIMQLYEQGKFNLDDDISDALGYSVRNPNFPDIKITYKMLLSHTSSLSDAEGYFDYDILKPEINLNYANAYWDYAPGEKYNYCNLGFNLLGALIEIHSGTRFDNYIRQNILLPLEIDDAGFNVDSLDNQKFVTLYNWQDSVWIESKDAYKSRSDEMENYALGKNAILFSPTGGMKISAVNLAKWMLCRMNYGSLNDTKIISEESSKQMFIPVEPANGKSSYGLGIMVSKDLVDGDTLIGHTGGAYGLTSAMFFNPDTKFGVVMITNGSSPKNGKDKIISDVVNAMYKVFYEKEKTNE
ncbi:MAG: beta-lactamase family protein [Prevotellaceae bacterium]|jgi:CubicO group peptidase (beta-lactamase class C family)|nr:beta-lactamase family protein [Prevotellaceae bacterium]